MSHEDLNRKEEVKGSSDRSFGLVFAAFFLIIAMWPLFNGKPVRIWSLGASVALLVIALAQPPLLAYPNRLWLRFGLLLNAVVSPLALGILFFLVITPIGLLLRLAGKDPLRLRLEPKASSYWIKREPPGPAPESMSNQF